jgi:hypothetical protein
MPSTNSTYVSAPLTNFSIGYHPRGLVARSVLDVVPVAKEAGEYFRWNRADAARVPNSLRADGAESNTLSFDLDSSGTYRVHEYALKTKITDRQRANADSVLKLEQAKTMRVKDLVELGLEQRVATLLTTSGSYASTNRVTLTGTDQWNNAAYAGSIESVIDTAKEAVRTQTLGLDPDTIIIPSAVAKVIKRDAGIRELIKYTHAELLVDGDLPPVLFGMRVVIPKAVNATSRKGATDVIADVWGKHVVLTVSNGGGMVDVPTFGKIFQMGAPVVKTWRKEELSADFYEYSMMTDEVITSNVAGYLIIDAIA